MGTGKKTGVTILVVALAGAACFGYYKWRLHRWRTRYEKAVALCDEARYTEACPLLRSVYDARPSSAAGRDALYRYAHCLDEMGRRQDALRAWRVVLSGPFAGGRRAEAMLALARGALDNGRPAEAKKYIGALVGRDERSAVTGDALFLKAEILEKEGDLAGAMRAAREVVDDYPECESVGRAQKKLGDLYMRLLFSRRLHPGTREYVVQPGDSLEAISKRFSTTVELLKKMNPLTIKGDSIRPNDRLKVCTERFSILIDKSANTLALKAKERIVKVYRVGTGKEGTTPVGEFTIVNKIVDPEWFKPGEGVIPYGDPENLLGTRWMGINSAGYGIHGTWEPETIGKQSSAGCVRLLNEDVEELFTIVPLGTKVTIIE